MALFVWMPPHPVPQVSPKFQAGRTANEAQGVCVKCLSVVFLLGVEVLLAGCGAAYHRDKFWNSTFGNTNGYQGYVVSMLNDTSASGWKTKYYSDLTTPGVTESQKAADRNRVINGYMLLADVAFFRFSGGYNDQIANFEIGADMVNLGLTAASAVTPPSGVVGSRSDRFTRRSAQR
jgi:hypothetical protein